MPNKDRKPSQSDSHPQGLPTHQGSGIPDPLAPFGGEPLEGSGFEAEIPEPESQWRDPR